MKENAIKIVGDSLADLNIFIDDVLYEKEGGNNYLRVVLDSNSIIDLNTVVEATKIIDPLIEENNLINEEYILDIYAKSKGDN